MAKTITIIIVVILLAVVGFSVNDTNLGKKFKGLIEPFNKKTVAMIASGDD